MLESFRKTMAERRLAAVIAQKCNLARSFEANGVLPGDSRFGKLSEDVHKAVAEFATRFGVVSETVADQYPSLVQLNRLAGNGVEPEGKRSVPQMIAGGFLALILSAAATGLVAGVFHWTYHLVAR